MRINSPTFVPKGANFTNLGQGLSKKVGFFLIFEPVLRAGFFDKMLALSNKKLIFVLVSGFLAAVFSQFCSQYSLTSLRSTLTHLETCRLNFTVKMVHACPLSCEALMVNFKGEK